MKKLPFSILITLLITSFSANAQLQKGSLQLGLSTGQTSNFLFFDGGISTSNVFGINAYSNDGERVVVVNLSPKIGYAATKNLLIGGEIGLGFVNYDGDENFTSYSFSPFVRGYFPIAKTPKLQFLAQVNGGVGGATSNEEFGVDFTTTNAGAGVGLAYFIVPAVSFDAMLGLTSLRIKLKDSGDDETYKQTQFGLNVGISVYLNHLMDDND